MVSLWRRNRRGTSTLGCLVSLVLFGAALYYGGHIAQVFWRRYQLEAEMQSQARLAPSLTDAVIRRRLVAQADELLLPPEAQRFRITRTGRPRRIVIETGYRDSLDLPLFSHTFNFKLRAEEPL